MGKTILKLRYWLTRKVVGNMPICMNMKITAPFGYDGHHFSQVHGDKGIFMDNYLTTDTTNHKDKPLIEVWRK